MPSIRIQGGAQGGNIKLTPNGAITTGNIDFTDSGSFSIGGDLTNSGKITVYEGGKLSIQKDVVNTGDIKINDPEKFKSIIVETLRTTGDIAKFGTEFLKKIGLLG